MKNNNKEKSRSDQNLDAENQNVAGGTSEGKKLEKSSPRVPKKPREFQKTRKSHKKKGTANDAPPGSIRWTNAGYAALLIAEAANPEMTRKQIIEIALKLYAQQLAFAPPIHLERIESDTLITLAGASTKWEKSCKRILREIILSELDDEVKARQVALLEREMGKLREERQIICRMAGIPISFDLLTDLEIATAVLETQQERASSIHLKYAYENAIKILKAYTPMGPGKIPFNVTFSHEESAAQSAEETPE